MSFRLGDDIFTIVKHYEIRKKNRGAKWRP